MIKLCEVAQAIKADFRPPKLGDASENLLCSGVSSDSRSIGVNELFVALRGENFAGHDFINAAKARGAVAALIDKAALEALSAAELDFPLLVVDNTRLSLGQLAKNWRARFNLPLFAITGSNGKTTTKEMLASILRAEFGEAVLVTQGNLNNDIGLPLTLLGLRAEHRAAVVEMGMNQPGEIAYLSQLANPTCALITNAQRAHLAGMGSLEAIAAEKGAIFSGLQPSSCAVFSADQDWSDLWRQQSAGHQVCNYSFKDHAEPSTSVIGHCRIHGLENRLSIAFQGELAEIDLAVPGQHNAKNALAAATAALAAGISLPTVARGLAAFVGVKGRLQKRVGMHGASLLDDTYNANPDSVRAAIDVLASTVGKQILVLGDMGEIGAMSAQFHDEIGGYAKSQGIDRLFSFGDAAALAAHNFDNGARHFKKIDDLIAALLREMNAETTVLIKGSRFMRMERVLDALTASTTQRAEMPTSPEETSCC